MAKSDSKQQINRLLFIHPGGLGDVLLLLPTLEKIKNSLGATCQIELLVEKRAFRGAQEIFIHSTPNQSNQAASTNYNFNNSLEFPLVKVVREFDFKGKPNFWQLLSLLNTIQGYDCVISSGSSPMVALLLFLSRAKKRIGFRSKFQFLLTDPVSLNTNQYAAEMLSALSLPLTEPIKQDYSVRPPVRPSRGFSTNLSQITSTTKTTSEFPQINKEFNQYMANPVDELISTRYVLIHPGVSALSIIKRIKKTPGPSFWIELLEKLNLKFADVDMKIVLVAGPDERESVAEIITALSSKLPKEQMNQLLDFSLRDFSIPELASLIQASQVFICADSAPLHLAVTVGANIISIFGPTDANKLLPTQENYSKKHSGKKILLTKLANLECQPCLWNRRSESCSLPICVDWLKPEVLINQVLEIIA